MDYALHGPENDPSARRPLALHIFVLLVVALALRIDGIESRSFGHPENFIPGVDVPDWVRQPPPRTTLDAVLATTPKDGHPPLYFILLHPWIGAFGTSLFSIRLPSALLGAASVVLLLLVSRRFLSPGPAFLVALCLACHGHHIYWSQLARMYVPAGFAVLAATWSLLRFHETSRERYRVGWFVAAFAAMWMHVYCWPVILAHIAWEIARALRHEARLSMLRTMIAAVALSIPVVGLAILQSPKSEWSDPPAQYFEFGYLFFTDFFDGKTTGPDAFQWIVRVLGVGVAALAIHVHTRESVSGDERIPTTRANLTPSWIPAVCGAASSAMLLAGALALFPETSRRRTVVIALSVVPPLLVVGTLHLERRIEYLRSLKWLVRSARFVSHLPADCALFPFLFFVGVGVVKSAFTARGMMIAVPFLLLLSMEGLLHLWRILIRRIAPEHLGFSSNIVCTAFVAIHLATLERFQQADSGPRDYAGFAAKLLPELRADDLVFVSNTYGDPPLFYYVPKHSARFVPADYRVVADRHPTARIWLIAWDEPEPASTMREAVGTRSEARRVHARNATAILYLPR